MTLLEISRDEAARAARRVMMRCRQLTEVTATPGAIERVYLSPEHARVNRLCAAWMREIGMTTWQDAAGNQIGRLSRPGEVTREHSPALIIGSHLDTVPNAGPYDGILGVLIGLEVARLLRKMDGEDRASSPLPFALEVVAFADEEGTRFGKALLGSAAFTGQWDPAWWGLTDADGMTLRQAFVDFGLDPARVADAARQPRDVVGYFEAHIEQGPELDRRSEPLAVVSSIASARRLQLVIEGEARHAGGTPYDMRHDALLGASEIALAVERICRDEHHVVGTVGQLETFPGAVNIVPGEVHLSLDLRGELDSTKDHVWASLTEEIDDVVKRRGLSWNAREMHNAPAVFCASPMQDVLREGIITAAGASAWSTAGEATTLFSPAGHDAMSMAAITDVGMLFLRNPDGISHHPDESVSERDVALGVSALAEAVLHYALDHR